MSKAGPVLFFIMGACYFLSGPFVTDPASMFDNQLTLHGTLHGIFGAVVFSLSAASCFVFWRRFRVDWVMERYMSLLLGEIPRLTDGIGGYGPKGKGYIAHVDIPPEVQIAFQSLNSEYKHLIRI